MFWLSLTDKEGDYYRLLIDGKYKLEVVKEGYLPMEEFVEVQNKPMTEAVKRDFQLTPINGNMEPEDGDAVFDNRVSLYRWNRWLQLFH